MRQKLGRKVVENKQEKMKTLQLLIEVLPGAGWGMGVSWVGCGWGVGGVGLGWGCGGVWK